MRDEGFRDEHHNEHRSSRISLEEMIYQKGIGIVSPLATGSYKNFEAVANGESRLRRYENKWHIPEPFFASLFEANAIDDIFTQSCQQFSKHRDTTTYTPFEKIAISAACEAILQAQIDPAHDDVLFILSTTKGNVDLLNTPHDYEPERIYLWRSAQLIAQFFGNSNTPIVVSNACISGCAAQLTAFNLLKYNSTYRHIIVIGAETLSRFVISGFQSFKALSSERCQPFDQNRCGLNLGEAAAAIVYAQTKQESELPENAVLLSAGAINNDANHISGPSRTGEGLMQSINKTIKNIDNQDIAFINAHGTATLYNDDMESMAIHRSGLQDIIVNSMKGYYGHTLGAAGVMEVILSSIALQKQMVLCSLGSQHPGTVKPLHVCQQTTQNQGNAFLKLISGFGGSNAALLFTLKHQHE